MGEPPEKTVNRHPINSLCFYALHGFLSRFRDSFSKIARSGKVGTYRKFISTSPPGHYQGPIVRRLGSEIKFYEKTLPGEEGTNG